MTTFQICVLLIALAQPADWWTTVRGIKSGRAQEGNPVLLRYKLWLYGQGHDGRWLWLTSIKIIAVIACVAMAALMPEASLMATVAAGAVAVLSWVVVWHNYRIVG